MCGLVAALSLGRPMPASALDLALTAIAHRGPDAKGVWRSPDGRVLLGHTRLAVIDPHGSPQPLTNEDGTIVGVVNGELYGFREARAALRGRGHVFRTQGDSEVALHLYEERGLSFLSALRGELALILWDAKARRLIAGVDRFGVKPICLARDGDRVLLASEVKGLAALGLELTWDRESVADATAMQYPLPGRTLFRGVTLLPPGHMALIEADGTITLQRWWDLDYPRLEARRPVSVPEVVERFGQVLDDAVRVRLDADVPVAFQLSGGIDSTAVVGLAARASPGPLSAFTLGFDDPRYDEAPIAEQTGRTLGLKVQRVAPGPEQLVALLEEAVFYGEGLAINAHLPAKLALSRAVRDAGFKVILTGEGADEVLAGYPHFRMDLGSDVAASNPLSAGIMLPQGAALSTDGLKEVLGWVPSFLLAKATLGHRLRGLLRDDVRAEFGARDSYRELGLALPRDQLEGRHRVEQAMIVWTKLVLPSYLMRTLGDGLEMASSIEGRLPYLDHHLFELLRDVPLELKIRAGTEKWIQREALKGVVPEPVRQRQKHPLLAPPLGESATFRRRLLEWLEEAGSPFFAIERVRAAVDGWDEFDVAGKTALDPALVLIATLTLLGRRFGL